MNKIVCPNCGRLTATAEQQEQYEYRESGLDGLILHGGVTKFTCACSRDSYYRVEKEAQLLQVIAMALLMKPWPLVGPELRYLRGACRLTQAKLADLLKVRRPTIAEREKKLIKAMSAADDFWFRAVMLSQFHELLLKPGESHLAPQHIEELMEFTSSFSKMTQTRLERIRSKKMTLSLVQGELWEMDQRQAA